MPRKIHIDQLGKTFEFPDGTSDADIDRIVQAEIMPAYAAKAPAAQPPQPAAPEQSWLDSTLKDAPRLAKEAASGFVKGSYSAPPNWAGMKLSQAMGLMPKQSIDTTAEKVGAGAEQLVEMMASGGALRKGAGYLATKMGALGRLAGPAARIGAEALNTGGNAALHDQPIGPAAAVGAGGAVVGEALSPLASSLKKAAVEQYSKVLAPTKESTKAITRKVVPQLLERNQATLTRGGLANLAGKNVERLGSEIDSAVQAVPASLKPDTKRVMDALEKYKTGFQVNGVDVDPDAIKKATELQSIVSGLGDDVSYQSLNRVRQIWDKKVAQAGGFAGKTLAEGSMVDAQKEGANAIRRELSKASPDIAKINSEFHFWKGVDDVLAQTEQRQTGQSGGLMRKLGTAAIGAGGLAHGGVREAAAFGLVAYSLSKAVQSTAWRTTSAVMKNQLADAIAKGSAKEATDIMTRITAAGLGAQTAKHK